MAANGLAYPCYCTAEDLELSRKLQRMSGKPPRYAGTCRYLTAAQRAEREARGLRPTLRFAVPGDQIIEFTDVVHGPQRFLSGDIGDFIIRRDDGTSAFFFCNAVDDSVMGVTQVLRGDDHLTNTPRQLMVLDALGMRRPGYGHVGLLVGADGAPLSKRHGSTSAQEFRERGFLPAAILNHLFRLGHASDEDGWLAPGGHARSLPPGTSRPRAGAFRRVPIGALAEGDGGTACRPRKSATWLGADDSAEFVELVRHNVVLPADAVPWRAVVRGELPPLGQDEQSVIAAAGPGFFAAAAAAFDQSSSDLKQLTKILKERTGRKGADLFMPLRVALTGQAHGPELGPLLKLMSPETARRRLESHAQNT